MTVSHDKPLSAVGAFWIEVADYRSALKLFDDGATLPRTSLRSRHLPARLQPGPVRGR
jgi:hypothetical protein